MRLRSLLIHLVLIVAVFVTLYPMIWVVRTAFSPGQSLSPSLALWPDSPTVEHFRSVLFDRPFFAWLRNSVIVSAMTTLIGVFLACTAAYAFSRFRFPGRSAGLLSFLISQMFPGTLMIIPLYLIMDFLGLLDRLTGLVFIYSTVSIPFCVWMLKGYFDTIPKDLEESALIDGASQTLIFWRIILPLSLPAVAVTALFSFITAWNDFILAATFMSEETRYTLPVGLQMMVGQFSSEWGNFAAGAILVSLPVMALFFLLQRYLVSGLTAGSVKG
ncbi:MAG: sugar ABC transporter permease [Deltaproteobacteria bacterium]|nr:MAG: sugar ABC transporter permease [Deltaproteobacteria bacterium]